MANNVGVFQWIRDAVRRSVLLGFSDAVEQIGVPADGNEINSQLLAVLRESAPALEHQPAPERPAARPERKRLGRSLDQIRDTSTKPTP
jgi:hypothetical protein